MNRRTHTHTHWGRRLMRCARPAALRSLGRRLRGLPADSEGQALTEFVIVLPVVLMACFAALQTVVVGEVVQYCNYAAYAAARSYATSYAKYQRDRDPNPHFKATARARCVAAMALAPVSHGLNYMHMFPGDPQPFSTGEVNDAMYAARTSAGNSDSPDALRQQLLEGFTIAFVYRIEGFRITPPTSDQDPRGSVDCRFTYRLPLALPGLASIWNYLQRQEVIRNIDAPTRIEDETAFGVNNPLADDAPFADPFPGGREFDPATMSTQFQEVLENWHSPANAGLANSLFVTYSQYMIGGGNGPVPANLRIGAKCRVGFEPMIGTMP